MAVLRRPVKGGGKRLDTGRSSHQAVTSRTSHATRLPERSRGFGKASSQTSFSTADSEREVQAATSDGSEVGT